jgi:hypothetical protein
MTTIGLKVLDEPARAQRPVHAIVGRERQDQRAILDKALTLRPDPSPWLTAKRSA